jgi:hypothetical protein
VIVRLTQEHLVIHEAIQEVDRALVQHLTRPENHDAIQGAIDYLTDALLSHLAYEEQELVEPLARLGFTPTKSHNELKRDDPGRRCPPASEHRPNLSILKNSHTRAIRFNALTAICDALGWHPWRIPRSLTPIFA